MGLLASPLAANTKLEIAGPPGSGGFGASVSVLPNGNFVVTDSSFDLTNPTVADVGAVYLYSADGELISRLSGDKASDRVGSGGVVVLANGNFVVKSPSWSNGSISQAGAVTWGHAETGFSGGANVVLSAANSLVGSQENDRVSDRAVTPLKNGHYVVCSQYWNHGEVVNAGAATWCNGETGMAGEVGSSNSLVGSQAGDLVGSGIVRVLSNGHYVVSSPFWDNGSVIDAGAATWCDGNLGLAGEVSAANSLVGSQANDQVGNLYSGFNYNGLVEVLANGHYVVLSPKWDNGPVVDAGAVTWCNGSTGLVGEVSAANSLVGSQDEDQVGGSGITELSNGHYVVNSIYWNNGGVADAGAATWCNGGTGLAGAVSAANSLVGSQAGDQVGYWAGGSGVIALSNGHYVVNSTFWDNGGVVDAGAVTWCNGSTGLAGAVSAANSLVGSQAGDQVGHSGVTALSNGHYVAGSAYWDKGGVADAGAATWCNGHKGLAGVVSSTNSLVGSRADDRVGSRIAELSNGHYVVSSPFWDNGAAANAGAATWGNGAKGIAGPVTTANSLVGSQTGDMVSSGTVAALTNGNYVVSSPSWNDGSCIAAGAVTWCNGSVKTTGKVTNINSLVGSTRHDRVGYGTRALSNGHYVVSSPFWDNGPVVDAGAATWGSGITGVRGPVGAANSLVGGRHYDNVGNLSLRVFDHGNYVVPSSRWRISDSPYADVGALTIGNPETGTVGLVTQNNSVFGARDPRNGLPVSFDAKRGRFVIGNHFENKVILFSASSATTVAQSVARTGSAAPGSADIFFGSPGTAVVNGDGGVLVDFNLKGSGASNGRNRGLFASPAMGGGVEMVMQSGDPLAGLGGNLPVNAQAAGLFGQITQHAGRGIFQATVEGSGITSLNNRLLLAENGTGLWLVKRNGQAIPELGGAAVVTHREVLQNALRDQVTLSYKLRMQTAVGVNSSNDTGLLITDHAGGVTGSSFLAREGQPAFSGAGTFGQFTGQAAVSPLSDGIVFGAQLRNGTAAVPAVFAMLEDGSGPQTVARAGDTAPGGVAPGVFSTFPAVGNQKGQALFKAILKGVPSSSNEGLWLGGTLLLREGDAITGLPGVAISSIARFWPAGADQVVVQAKLRGAGVNTGNNQALILRQADGQHLVLARTGDSLAGGGTAAKLRSFAAVEVNPQSGRYVMLTTLKNCPSTSNLALWMGCTSLGSDTSEQALRLPVLRVRKGGAFGTTTTFFAKVRGISIKPAEDRSGAGGRGRGQIINAAGAVAVFILGDFNITELVLLPPN